MLGAGASQTLMTTVDIIVLVFVFTTRGIAPVFILRWPFWGALACILADATDTMFQDAVGSSILTEHYHNIDKAFDTYYLAVEAYVAFHWLDPLAKWTALVLFSLRVIAVALYELFDLRGVMFYLGPNIFENFYLWVAGFLTVDASYRIRTRKRLVLILLFVGVPKLLQEYVMHYLDSQTWHFVKRYILLWR
jgi:hypothetical protein